MPLVQAQVADDVRSGVEKVLSDQGLTLTEAFQFFLERTAQEQAIPTEVFRPNAETLMAIEAARCGDVYKINSIRDLITQIDAEIADENA